MIRRFSAAALLSLLAATSSAWAASQEGLSADGRAKLFADFLATIGPISAPASDRATGATQPELVDFKVQRPSDVQPSPPAPRLLHGWMTITRSGRSGRDDDGRGIRK
jgi:hypothetical protein